MKQQMVTLGGALALSVFLFVPLNAEVLGGSAPTQAGVARPLTAAMFGAASWTAADTPADAAYQEWKRRFDNAQRKRHRGKLLLIGGLGAGIVGGYLKSRDTDISEILSGSGGGADDALADILIIGGAAGLVWGAFEFFDGGEKLSRLRDEGFRDGYFKVRTTDGLSLRLVPGGVQVAVGVSF